MTETVEVLLATYNGAAYLREQVESILRQTYPSIRILARDDGSTDETPQILAEYAARFPESFVVIRDGQSTGSAKGNFVRLMQESTAKYMAFADQDDVWLPEKIAVSMEEMKRLELHQLPNTPLLVFSDLRVVDAQLHTLHASMWEHQHIQPANVYRLNRLLAQNVVTGCTALLNRSLVDVAKTMPESAHMHDWWIALLASSFGKASPLPRQLMLYRQHGGNVLGAAVDEGGSGIPDFHNHAERAKPWQESVSMARALLKAYGEKLTVEQNAVSEAFVTCDTSTSRFKRVITWFAYRLFLSNGLRANLALLWYLWDKPGSTN